MRNKFGIQFIRFMKEKRLIAKIIQVNRVATVFCHVSMC